MRSWVMIVIFFLLKDDVLVGILGCQGLVF